MIKFEDPINCNELWNIMLFFIRNEAHPDICNLYLRFLFHEKFEEPTEGLKSQRWEKLLFAISNHKSLKYLHMGGYFDNPAFLEACLSQNPSIDTILFDSYSASQKMMEALKTSNSVKHVVVRENIRLDSFIFLKSDLISASFGPTRFPFREGEEFIKYLPHFNSLKILKLDFNRGLSPDQVNEIAKQFSKMKLEELVVSCLDPMALNVLRFANPSLKILDLSQTPFVFDTENDLTILQQCTLETLKISVTSYDERIPKAISKNRSLKNFGIYSRYKNLRNVFRVTSLSNLDLSENHTLKTFTIAHFEIQSFGGGQLLFPSALDTLDFTQSSARENQILLFEMLGKLQISTLRVPSCQLYARKSLELLFENKNLTDLELKPIGSPFYMYRIPHQLNQNDDEPAPFSFLKDLKLYRLEIPASSLMNEEWDDLLQNSYLKYLNISGLGSSKIIGKLRKNNSLVEFCCDCNLNTQQVNCVLTQNQSLQVFSCFFGFDFQQLDIKNFHSIQTLIPRTREGDTTLFPKQKISVTDEAELIAFHSHLRLERASRSKILTLLLLAREKLTFSLFYRDYFPLDILKYILKMASIWTPLKWKFDPKDSFSHRPGFTLAEALHSGQYPFLEYGEAIKSRTPLLRRKAYAEGPCIPKRKVEKD